jgi:legumain
MARWWVCGLLSLLAVAAAAAAAEGKGNVEPLIRLPTLEVQDAAAAPAPAPPAAGEEEEGVTRWAVLVAGSNGFENYRHQVRVLRRLRLVPLRTEVQNFLVKISPFLCTLA